MTPYEERLLDAEVRARARAKRLRTLWRIAIGFDRQERAEMWERLRVKAEAWADHLWSLRVEAGVGRWAADDRRGVLVRIK